MRLDRQSVSALLEATVPAADSIVVVHPSLIALGCEPAGLKWSLLAPLRRLADRGATLALPTFTFGFCAGAPFDVRRSRSESGQLGDWLLELEGARRTDHPIYSFAVLGPRAQEIAACRSRTTFGPDSPFRLFHEANARIVMLGADWSYCTQFHHYEERAEVPYRAYKTFRGTRIDAGGAHEVEARMFVRDLEIDARNDFAQAVDELRAKGRIASAALARGRVEAVDCRDLGETCESLLRENALALVADGPRVERAIALAGARRRNAPMRLAVLGSRNTALISRALEEAARAHFEDRRTEIWAPAYGQLWQTVLDRKSELHAAPPAVSFFVDRLEDVLGVGHLDEVVDPAAAAARAADYAGLVGEFAREAGGTVVVNRFARLRAAAAGQADDAAGGALVESANRALEGALSSLPNVHLLDLAGAAARFPGPAVDDRLWHLGRFPFAQGFSAHLARRYLAIALAAAGKTARLLVVDLDGTLWGGILGEDGIEGLQLGGDWPGNAHLELQRTLRRLSERGLAIAICSKNDEDLAREAMDRLESMVFTLDHAVAHRINWQPKWRNLVDVAEELNLGLEHVAFLDDNPVEREQMRRQLPEVKVIDLPDDPARFAEALLDNPYLECLDVTPEDRKRAGRYRSRARLERERRRFADTEAFYASLEARMHLSPLNPTNLARAAQLMAKTNQFNTTTRRYDGAALQALARQGHGVYVVGLEDRFSELENIGLAILKFDTPARGTAEIDDLLLSCRVLGRGVETALVEWLKARAAKRGMTSLEGRIIETPRNTPVRELYGAHGFAPAKEAGLWRADLGGHREPPPRWIEIVDHCADAELADA